MRWTDGYSRPLFVRGQFSRVQIDRKLKVDREAVDSIPRPEKLFLAVSHLLGKGQKIIEL
jgi:hypothetical protein